MNTPYAGPTPLNGGQDLFGRETEIEELQWRVTADRIIVLYSASGAGKTSLLKARNGLLAQLSERFLVLPSIRLHGKGGVDPVAATLQQLASVHQSPVDQESLTDYFNRIHIPEHQPPKRVLMVIDQFEEIFSNCYSHAQRHEFFRQLGILLAREHSPVWAIFSMREEYFSWLDDFRELVPTRLINTFRLNLLTVQQAVAAIKGPAEAHGVRFPMENGEDAATRLALELGKFRVRNATGGVDIQQGDRIEAVIMQVVCVDLWRRLSEQNTPVEQIRIADVENFNRDDALQDYCDSALTNATPDSGRGILLRDWIDRRLMTQSGLRLPAMVDPSDKKDPTDRELAALEEIHLIRRQSREDGAWYELSHDSLVIPVRRSIENWRLANLAPWQALAHAWQLGGERARYFRSLPRGQLRGIPLPSNEGAYSETELRFLDACAMYRQHTVKSRIWMAIVAVLAVFFCVLYTDKITKEATLVAERNVTALQAGVLAILSGNPSVGLGARAAVTGTELQKTNPTAVAFNFRSVLSDYLNQNRNIVNVESEGDGASTMIVVDADYRVVAATGERRYAVDVRDLHHAGNIWRIDPSVLRQQHPGGIRVVALLGKGRLATGGGDGRIQIWNIPSRQPDGPPLIAVADRHQSLMHSPVRSMGVAGDLLYAGYEQGVVAAWDIAAASHAPVWTFRAQARVSALATWDAGKGVALADISGNEHIRLVRLVKGMPQSIELIASPKENNYRGAFYSIAVSPDEQFVAAGNRAGKIHIWDIATQTHLRRIDAHDQAVAQLKFLKNGDLLSIGWDGRIKRWPFSADTKAQAGGQTVLEFRRQLVSIAIEPPELSAFVSTEKGDILKISLVADTHPFGRTLRGAGPFATLSETSSGMNLVGASSDSFVIKRFDSSNITDLPPGPVSLPGIVGMARAESAKLTFIARGVQVEAVRDDQLAGPAVGVVANVFGRINSIQSNDAGTLLIVRTDRATQVWAVPRFGSPGIECMRSKALPLTFPSGPTRLVVFRPSSSDFISVGNGAAQYWSVTDKAAACPTIEEHSEKLGDTRSEIQAATFERDGKVLWAGDYIGQVYSIEIDSAAHQANLKQTESITPPSAIAVSANGTIAIGDARGGLNVYQPGSSFPLKLAQDFHDSEITSLAISRDGNWMVSSSNEGTVIWDLNIDTWIRRACELANNHSFSKIESDTFFNRVSDKPAPCAAPR